jgi:hypothetical protein
MFDTRCSTRDNRGALLRGLRGGLSEDAHQVINRKSASSAQPVSVSARGDRRRGALAPPLQAVPPRLAELFAERGVEAERVTVYGRVQTLISS